MSGKIRLTIRQPVSIREKVYRVIREDILNGSFSPGQRMVETRLAEQIKISRTPVREALHMLEREGLLESIPRVGYRVKELKWDEVGEICEIRKVNEVLAARWAIKRITSRELQGLEDNVRLSEKEVRAGNPKAFIERDAEFHEILVRASGSERLVELCQMLRRHMLRYRMESLYLAETALEAISGHYRIVECIRGKDESGIDLAIREHLDFARDSVRKYAFREKRKKGR
ncbi:MAG: GntR family transcriptional regulator [Deltaproteobacteria bacterium]|nr:GntR family transcriptional regulator [Deltaproteobacteria bacterium]